MQIATLSYQYDPKENINGDARAKLRHQRVLTTLTYPQKKSKQRKSVLSDLSTRSNVPLPPITNNVKRPKSIRIRGNGLISSKLVDTSAYSFNQPSRSRSRQSNKSDVSGTRSRPVSPAGTLRPASKLVRLKFGYPVKLRSADFYGPDKSETELRFREESFINDSVRSAAHSRRSSIIPSYEALDDPHLRRFFQSPIVLDIVRKSLTIEHNNSYKPDESKSKISKLNKRAKSNDLYDNQNVDYRRIVTKGSSGYAKLNGYDCIPSYAPARRRRSSTVEPTTSTSYRRSTHESYPHRSITQDKYQASANTSFTSAVTHSHNQIEQETKTKSRKYVKSKQPKPLATSSPLRHPVRHLVETTTSIIELSSAVKTDGPASDQKSEIAAAASVSQDEHKIENV